MNARVESMSHGDGKVYLQMVLDRIQEDARLILEATLKNGTTIPAHLFAFTPIDAASQANYVVILPHCDVREVDLTFVEYLGEGAPVSQSKLTVELNMVRWKTRFNTLVHNELTAQMLDIEREYCADRMNVYFTDTVDDGDEIVVKMLIDMPSVQGSNVMVDFTDLQGNEIDLPVYPLLDEKIHSERFGEDDRLHVGFSVRVRADQKDFCVTVYDANNAVPGGFACFCDETYEPLHEAFAFLHADAAHDESYEDWYRDHCETLASLALQRKAHMPCMPLISLVLPLYAGDECYLPETLAALATQTYTRFELVVVDAGLSEAAFSTAFAEWKDDDRLVHIELGAEADEATARLTGIMQSTGQMAGVLDPRVMLAPGALFEVVRRVNEVRTSEGNAADPYGIGSCELVYANHDFFDHNSALTAPNLKPVYSPDLLYSYDYMGPFVLIGRRVIEAISEGVGFSTESFQYDLALKATEVARGIERIDQVLYHVQDSRAFSAEASKTLARREEEAFRGGRKAVANLMRRRGVDAVVLSEVGERLYRVRYRLPNPAPSLAVVIPSKDQIGLLDACLTALVGNNSLTGYEVIIVDNGSVEEETQGYYQQLPSRFPQVKTRILPYNKPFSISAMVNLAAANTDADYLMLLDNDTEMTGTDTLALMLAHCMRSDVGVVGAKLLFADDTIQHAGMMVGPYGSAANLGVNMPRNDRGYNSRYTCANNVSAVSSSAMMVKHSVFTEVGGFEEKFVVGVYDVDFCLKVAKAGYRVVYNGAVELYHQENATTGHSLTRAQRLRLEREHAYLHYRWPKYFVDGDPYMSSCLDPELAYYHLS